jgi:hypothetical protein
VDSNFSYSRMVLLRATIDFDAVLPMVHSRVSIIFGPVSSGYPFALLKYFCSNA